MRNLNRKKRICIIYGVLAMIVIVLAACSSKEDIKGPKDTYDNIFSDTPDTTDDDSDALDESPSGNSSTNSSNSDDSEKNDEKDKIEDEAGDEAEDKAEDKEEDEVKEKLEESEDTSTGYGPISQNDSMSRNGDRFSVTIFCISFGKFRKTLGEQEWS